MTCMLSIHKHVNDIKVMTLIYSCFSEMDMDFQADYCLFEEQNKQVFFNSPIKTNCSFFTDEDSGLGMEFVS